MAKKIQQFSIMKLEANKILANNLDVHNNLYEAKKNLEIVDLGDNQVLRVIRRLTNHDFDENKLNELILKKQKLRGKLKKQPDNELKKELFETLKFIDNMVYIPEYVSVVSETRAQYNKVASKGFNLNDEHYVRLLCSAGNARNNTAFFIKENLFNDVYKILSNEHNKIKIAEAKYNAYFALCGSATFEMSTPKIVVVPDYEATRKELVDWVNFDGKYNVTEKECELKFNLWDGMGLISPMQSEKWAQELQLDYIPSGYLVRAPFIKGMVYTFDFHKFAHEKSANKKIKDVWGNEHHVDDIEMIITQSQFKLWMAYNNIDHYKENINKFGLSFGVAKYTPKEDKNYIRTNYQFLQVLNLNDEEIKQLCQPTIDWLDGVQAGDINYIKLYLLGKMAEKEDVLQIWENLKDPYIKALLLCEDVKCDSYIQGKISQSLQKRIKEGYIGKLLINGNFQMMISDPYALCEHIFGMEIKGLLNRGEYYSQYWNKKNVQTIAGMRSPLTWRSEINKMELKQDEGTNEWYKYLNSGIIYNVFGIDSLIHAGSDFDGDLVCTTNNEFFIKNCFGGLPVLGEHASPNKKDIKLKKLYKFDGKAFNTKIGFITNCSTTLYEMLTLFDKDSEEYEEIIKRLKLCCHFQALTIDSAKGIKTQPFPKWWTRWQGKNENDTEEDKESKRFNNSLLIQKRPEFMRHLYSNYNLQYKQFKEDYDRICEFNFGKSLNDLNENDKKTEEYRIIKEKYDKFVPLLETNGTMNKIYRNMENSCKKIKVRIKEDKNSNFFKVYMSKDFEIDNEKLNFMIAKYNEYLSFKKNSFLQEQYGNMSKFCQYLKDEIQWISLDEDEFLDLAIYVCYVLNKSKPKDFVWDLFGNEIVKRISINTKNTTIKVPMRDNGGDIKYLEAKYSIRSEDINDYI